MESEIIKWVVGQGVGVVLAAVVFYFYQKNLKGQEERQDETIHRDLEHAKRLQELTQAFVDVITRNTAQLQQLVSMIGRQNTILENMERRISTSHLCPLTSVSADDLRETADPLDAVKRVTEKVRNAILKGDQHVREGSDSAHRSDS